MDKKIKIAFISYGLDVGGIETLILEICKRLPSDRYSLCVCEFQGNGKLQKEFEEAGVEVYTVKKTRNLDWALPFKLARLFKQQHIDIVHAHGQSPWLYAGIAAKLAGVPVVYTEHTTPDVTINQNIQRWKKIEKVLSMITARITTVSDSIAGYMVNEAGISAKKVKVIYNGIDAKIYDRQVDVYAKRKELGINEADLVIGSVASLLPKKDPETLLKAFKLVIQKVPYAKLVMVGDGPLKDSLWSMVNSLLLNDKVIFLGNRRDVPELLKIFDVFALSSVKEGLPIAALEAMASGLAVVATDVDGNPEVVQHGKTGFIVPARNPEALADSIVKLLLDRNEAKKMGVLAQEMVKEYFSFEKMIAEYENIYISAGAKAKNKNILIITNLFPNPQEPNRGIFVAEMVRELKNSADITMISPIPWVPKWGVLKRFKGWYKFSQIPYNYEINGQKVICPKYLAIPKLGSLHSFFMFVSLYPKVKQLHKEKRFDLINAQWLFPDGVASCRISKILNIPIVLSAHGCDINLYMKMKSRRGQILKALNACEAVTVVSGQQKKSLLESGIPDSKISVIKNGFNENFKVQNKITLREELGLSTRQQLIIFLGQLVEVKGFTYLISAVKQLENASRNGYEVIVVGTGPLSSMYEKKVSEMGLSEKIKFYGEKKHNEIQKWLGASDMLCLPSIREGCPTVVLEALACGKPVVASKVGEVPELVNEKSGILFNPKDVNGLAESLSKAMSREWDENEISSSVKHLSWKSVAGEYFNVFTNVLSKKDVKK